MPDRISFITHHSKPIMVVDLSHCEPKEILLLLDEAQHTIALHQRDSLLTLGDMTGAHIDRAVATRLKEVLVLDRPFVKRSAWVGDADSAMERLVFLAKTSGGPDHGELKFDPAWDAVHCEVRFAKMLDGLRPEAVRR